MRPASPASRGPVRPRLLARPLVRHTLALALVLGSLAGCATWRNTDLADQSRASAVLKTDLDKCNKYADDLYSTRPDNQDFESGRGPYAPLEDFRTEYDDQKRRDAAFTRCMNGRGWVKK